MKTRTWFIVGGIALLVWYVYDNLNVSLSTSISSINDVAGLPKTIYLKDVLQSKPGTNAGIIQVKVGL